jgi:DNA repair ATPase RecN
MGLELTNVEVLAMERISKSINVLAAEITDIRKVQDGMVKSNSDMQKTLTEVTRTCDRIMDRLDAMDSQTNLAEKRIFNVENDTKEQGKKLEELVSALSTNADKLVQASVSVGSMSKINGTVSAGALSVGGIAFVVDLLVRLFGNQ